MIFPALLEAGDDPLFVQRGSVAVVYLHLIGRLDFAEFHIQKATSIARRLSMDKHTAGDALRALCQRGYLMSKPFDGRTRAYRLVYSRAREG